MKVNSLKRDNPNFPQSLLQIDSSPNQIYYCGQELSNWLDKPKLVVVGSRKISNYGLDVTTKLVSELAQAGVVIVSGLAYGVDAAAHKAALAAGGQTVAILGTSLEKIYPSIHLNLARQIMEQGSLISEYGPHDPIYKANFIYRNRIVTALSDGVLITEASIRSGTLTTARFALEQGKTVMAVPGNITNPNSEGCNNLIKSGALPVTSADDVFFALGLNPSKTKSKRVFRGSEREQAVLALIAQGVADQEELALKAACQGAQIATILTTLELAGFVRPAGGGQWVLA